MKEPFFPDSNSWGPFNNGQNFRTGYTVVDDVVYYANCLNGKVERKHKVENQESDYARKLIDMVKRTCPVCDKEYTDEEINDYRTFGVFVNAPDATTAFPPFCVKCGEDGWTDMP